jgi:hypothetical protein
MFGSICHGQNVFMEMRDSTLLAGEVYCPGRVRFLYRFADYPLRTGVTGGLYYERKQVC